MGRIFASKIDSNQAAECSHSAVTFLSRLVAET